MFDEFLYKNRWYIGGLLILIIAGGFWLVLRDSGRIKKENAANIEIAELRKQNDILRQELSSSSQQVAGAQDTAQEEAGKININTASTEELDTLPNIGPARAADIISYRDSNGGFKTIEEIKNIKGIGDKSFESLKDLITVGGAGTEVYTESQETTSQEE